MWCQRFNEWVLLNQRAAASRALDTTVLVSIVLAGVLVGVQSYPAMEVFVFFVSYFFLMDRQSSRVGGVKVRGSG